MSDSYTGTQFMDIDSKENIELMVDTFYQNIRKDHLLGPIFNEKISDWEPHLETMYKFWEKLLFSTGEYSSNPFAKHINLQVDKEHFATWIKLFSQNIDDNFRGPKADEAKRLARNIAATFQLRMGIDGYDKDFAIPDYKHPKETQ
jgi:hemoglobin